MAIPVFLRDTFYLIENSTSEEIFKILKEEGVESSTLRGKATFQFPAASFDAVKSVIKNSLSSAQIAFYQAGDGFFAMPITNVDALSYYKTNDGKLYASEQDYHMNKLSQSSRPIHNPVRENVYNPEIQRVYNPEEQGGYSSEERIVTSPVLGSAKNDDEAVEETVTVEKADAQDVVKPIKVPVRVKKGPMVKKAYRFVSPESEAASSVNDSDLEGFSANLDQLYDETTDEFHRIVAGFSSDDEKLDLDSQEEFLQELQNLGTTLVSPNEKKVHAVGAEAVHGGTEQGLVPIQQYKDEYTEEQRMFLENAEFLDTVLTNGSYLKIADYLLFNLGDVSRLMDVMGEEFEQEIKIPTLEAAYMSNFVEGSLPEGKFRYEVGESERLIDSMIMLPVFSALLGKRNKSLQNKFSVANLVGSKFARVSVAGISSSGTLCGFVHFEEITNEAVAAAKKKVEEYLTATGKKMNELTSQEKYELYLKEISAYYVNHKDCGKMLLAPNSSRYVDLSRALAEVEKQKFSVPEFYDSEQGMITWSRHETIAFDNRGEKTLLEQAKEVVKPTKVLVTAEEKKAETTPIIFSPEIDEDLDFASDVDKSSSVIPLGTGTVEERVSSVDTAHVIHLPSSFEDSYEEPVEDEEILSNGLSSGEIDSLLHTLVRSSKPVAPATPVVKGIGPGERVIAESIKFSNTPSLTNPIAYIDAQGHEWVSKEAYDLAMSSIGLSGDLLGDNPLELLEDEEVKVKGK